jgi:hypothetical protein
LPVLWHGPATRSRLTGRFAAITLCRALGTALEDRGLR